MICTLFLSLSAPQKPADMSPDKVAKLSKTVTATFDSIKTNGRRLSDFDVTTLCGTPGTVGALMVGEMGSDFPGATASDIESCFCNGAFDMSTMEDESAMFGSTGLCGTGCTNLMATAMSASMEGYDSCMNVNQFVSCICSDPSLVAGMDSGDMSGMMSSTNADCQASFTSLMLCSFSDVGGGDMGGGDLGGGDMGGGDMGGGDMGMGDLMNMLMGGAAQCGSCQVCLVGPDCYTEPPGGGAATPANCPGTWCGGAVSEDPCFPSDAMVTLADGTPARLDALKAGDAIVSLTADGTLTTDTVSLFSLANKDKTASFVELTTTANATLRLTQGHHVPVGAACCDNLKQAKDVKVGETIYTVADGAVKPATVSVVSSGMAKGLHNPLMTNGAFPVIDGVATSFNAMPIVTLDSYVLPYLLPLCSATGTCDLLRTTVHALECAFSSDGTCKARHYIDGLTLAGKTAQSTAPVATEAAAACTLAVAK